MAGDPPPPPPKKMKTCLLTTHLTSLNTISHDLSSGGIVDIKEATEKPQSPAELVVASLRHH